MKGAALVLLALGLISAEELPVNITVDSAPTSPAEARQPETPEDAQSERSLTYEGHSVLKVVPESDEQLKNLRGLFNQEPQLDVWKTPSTVGESVHFRVSPKERAQVENYLDSHGLKHEVFIPDVQDLINKERGLSRGGTFDWSNFHRINSINSWLAGLAAHYSNVSSLVEGGRTYERRPIVGLKIAHKPNLPVFFLEGGIHAREWISPAVVTYILYQLLASNDPAVQKVAASYEWHIFPSVNPDGYEFSHTRNRFWRKTRSRTSIYCYGVDPNRNWNVAWAKKGASFKPCADTFAGMKAESEVETRTRVRYMDPLMDRMKAFVALHSYGQFLLFPWGHTHSHSGNHQAMLEVGKKAGQALKARYGTTYRVGSLAETLYEASGSSMDWAHANGARFAYTLELRDMGDHGFLLPADQIIPAGQETMDAILVIAKEVLKRP